MCGIVGYVGEKNARDVVLNGLKTLEYRGYDSAGVAFLADEIKIFKTGGRVSDLNKILPCDVFHVGIGHTRWATHGAPTAVNAHPHISFDGNFAVVHNGVVTNCDKLKAELKNKGIKLVSDTDSEIIAHLMALEYDGDMLSTIEKVASRLQGATTFLVMRKNDEAIYMRRYGASLAVGVAKDGQIVASDTLAITPYTKDVAVLCDGECATIDGKTARFFKNGKEIVKPFGKIDRTSPKDCSCHMRAEIDEIPSALLRAYDEVRSCVDNTVLAMLKDAKRILFCGCGTAYHACLYGKRVFEKTGVPCDAVIASEIDDVRFVDEDCLCVFITQSGETADTLLALAKCKSSGAKTVAVTNVQGSTITFDADRTIFIGAGAEIAVAATKSYVCQLLALYILARARQDEMPEQKTVKDLAEKAKRMLKENLYEPDVKEANLFFIGKGADNVTAKEGALKFKEITCKMTDAYCAGELKHGSIALIDQKSVAYVIATNEKDVERVKATISELRARKARVYCVTTSKEITADKILALPKLDDEDLYPVLAIIPLQNLALTASLCLGLDPDKPRNLAKSVTVI